PGALLWFNPFVAQADDLCGTETGFGTYCSIIGFVTDRPPPGLGDVSQPLPAPGVGVGGGAALIEPQPQQFGVQRDGYWPRATAAWILLSLVLIVLSVQLV